LSQTPEAVVQHQIDAYNACDLNAFAETYSSGIVVRRGDGGIICKGQKALRELYGKLFHENPDQMALIMSRITGGEFVVDDEEVIGRADGKRRRAVAIYRVCNGLIDEVTLISK